jgi:hypothetical protein
MNVNNMTSKYTNSDREIRDVLRSVHDGDIDLNPEWQRNAVWNKKQKTKLIESIFSEFPINPIVLWKRADGIQVCVDGKNRITAIDEFCKSMFSADGKRYDAFSPSERMSLDRYTLNFRVLQGDWWTEDRIQNYFCIIQEGCKLSPAEKRNATQGKFTELIRALVNDAEVRHALLRENKNTDRMQNADKIANIVSLHPQTTILTKHLVRDGEVFLGGSGEQLDKYYKAMNGIAETQKLPAFHTLKQFILKVVHSIRRIEEVVPGAWKLKITSPDVKPSLREFMTVANLCANGVSIEAMQQAFRILDNKNRQGDYWVTMYRSVMPGQAMYSYKALKLKTEALQAMART